MRLKEAYSKVASLLKRKKNGALEKGSLQGGEDTGQAKGSMNGGESGADKHASRDSSEAKPDLEQGGVAEEMVGNPLESPYSFGPGRVDGAGLDPAEDDLLPPVDELQELESASGLGNGLDFLAQQSLSGAGKATRQRSPASSEKQPWGASKTSAPATAKSPSGKSLEDTVVTEAQQRAQERLRQAAAAKRKEEDSNTPEDGKKSRSQIGWGGRIESSGSKGRGLARRLSAPPSPTRSDLSVMSDVKGYRSRDRDALSDSEAPTPRPLRTPSLPANSRLLAPTVSSMQRSIAAAKEREAKERGGVELEVSTPVRSRRASDPTPPPTKFSPDNLQKEKEPHFRRTAALSAGKTQSARPEFSTSNLAKKQVAQPEFSTSSPGKKQVARLEFSTSSPAKKQVAQSEFSASSPAKKSVGRPDLSTSSPAKKQVAQSEFSTSSPAKKQVARHEFSTSSPAKKQVAQSEFSTSSPAKKSVGRPDLSTSSPAEKQVAWPEPPSPSPVKAVESPAELPALEDGDTAKAGGSAKNRFKARRAARQSALSGLDSATDSGE